MRSPSSSNPERTSVQIRLDLATCSLKDAEHAIFLIGAYFGLVDQRITDVRIAVAGDQVQTTTSQAVAAILPPLVAPAPVVLPESPQDGDPSVFAATPPQLPADAGESPATPDPAAVFGAAPGNAVAGTVTGPATSIPTPTSAPAFVAPPPVAPIAPAPVGTSPTPPAPAASAPQAPSGVEVDATGLPWDGRIHASGEGGAKPKNADGKWRKKRGLNDAALVAKVEAELRATMQGVAAAPAPVPTPPPAAMLPTPPQMPTPPAPPAAPQPQADPTNFVELMARVTPRMVDNTVPKDALTQAAGAYGVPSVPMLANRPDLIPSVWAYLRSLYPALA